MLRRARVWAAIIAFYSAFSLIYAVPACTSPQGARQLDAELSPAEKKQLSDYAAEMEIGRNMAGRLLAHYGTQSSEALLGYVNQVGNYVASYGDYPERRYMFEILDSDMVNAFACPGGYILVTMGAIKHANNEAELAAILGHEAAHVGKKHMYNTLSAMSEQEMEKAATEQKIARMPEPTRVRKRPDAAESATGTLIAKYLANNSGISFLKAARAGMSVILEKGLDAKLEYEADQEGVKYAIRAGYDPNAMTRFLCRLEAKKQGVTLNPREPCRLAKLTGRKKSLDILDRTHPPIKRRVSSIRRVLKSMNAEEIIGATGTKRFRGFSENL